MPTTSFVEDDLRSAYGGATTARTHVLNLCPRHRLSENTGQPTS
ncbi:hypothetical protein UG55_1006202 [Frankia sp. EI5c]|nr:hypothetical protein UG55_1006202 [Frankia sp. EI5c]